jgi:hypothetical protein
LHHATLLLAFIITIIAIFAIHAIICRLMAIALLPLRHAIAVFIFAIMPHISHAITTHYYFRHFDAAIAISH